MLRLCKQQFCSISEDVNLEMEMSRESIFVAQKSGLSQSRTMQKSGLSPNQSSRFFGNKFVKFDV